MVFRSGNRVQDAIRTESAIRIAEAHERARKLELEVSQQKERTANAERELLVLQERTSRRALTPKQQEAFRAAIADRPMDIGVTVVGDQEAIAFADDIVRVLKAAKWRVSIMNIGVIAPPVYGVVISTRPQYKLNPEPEVDLQHLFSGLRQASVVFVAAPKAGFQKKLPELLVGLRPITK
jgi:hypothetical protein